MTVTDEEKEVIKNNKTVSIRHSYFGPIFKKYIS